VPRYTGCAALCIVVASLVPATPATAAARPKLTAARAFSLPSAQRCLAGRALALRVRKVRGVRWKRAVVKLNGKRVKRLRGARVTRPIRLRHLPPGTLRLSIAATARGGRRVSARRTYRRCKPTPAPDPAPAPPTPPGPPAPAPPEPGSYSGLAGGQYMTLYVSRDRAHIQDVRAPTSLSCAGSPGSVSSDTLVLRDIAIAADGSFDATVTRSGISSGTAVTYTLSLKGRAEGSTVTGTLRQDRNSGAGNCTSGTLTFSATRDAQGPQTGPPPPAGSYSGLAGGASLSLYVAPDGKSVQDVFAVTSMGCVGAGGSVFGGSVIVDEAPIASDGSFVVTSTRSGLHSGAPATFTTTFAGHVHGTNSSGVARLSGDLREDITYDDGTVHTCTSNVQAWSATRESQGSQIGGLPPAGDYSGLAGGQSLTLSVDAGHLKDVVATTFIGCPGGGGSGTPGQALIDDTAIEPDGSFSATSTRTGTFSGFPATFTSIIKGHAHGTTLAGAARLAGSVREDITYDNGTVHTCTSNLQSWRATRG
jgi:hypothetical protein